MPAHRKILCECLESGLDFQIATGGIIRMSGESNKIRIRMPAISRYRDAILSDLLRAKYIAEILFIKLGVGLHNERQHP